MPTIYISDSGDDKNDGLSLQTAIYESVPNDGPSMTFIKRIDGLATNSPGDGWDGSWHLEQK